MSKGLRSPRFHPRARSAGSASSSMPSVRAMLLAEPRGSSVARAPVPARAVKTFAMVPSPPATTIRSAVPSSAAVQSSSVDA